MSRIYLILFAFFYFSSVLSQGTREDYILYANQQKEKGDYIEAVKYYEKALVIDSNTVDVLWNYAESLRLYKEYRKAERIYQKIYDKEETALYLRSLFYLAEMQKYNGKYDEALESFKLAKKKYANDKKGYLYQKCKQEIESCLWARKEIKDTIEVVLEKLPASVNSANSEFGHSFYDNTLFFSTLRADSINKHDEIYSIEYKNDIYSVNPNSGEKAKRVDDIHSSKFHVGNGSFSLDKKRFYYSICKEVETELQCKIMVAYYVNGRMRSIDTLGEIINESDANTTMPYIANFDNNEVLFFASNRVGSKGGLDIFYSYIKDGTQFSKPIPVESINTIDNELSPFFDDKTQKLYFSSTWHYGFGGYDVFSCQFDGVRFGKIQNLGFPINSSANDLYYFNNKEVNYFSSNRIGVTASLNPTCCSDIFSYSFPKIEIDTTNIQLVEIHKENTIKETFEAINKRLPVTLYFHNDIPNPRSTDTTSKVNYIESYQDYMAMIPQYKKEYSKGLTNQKQVDAQEDIESFFIEFVEQGVKDLEIFRDLLLQELEKGNSITLTVKGFASPLAKSDYNVNLTKRRIASLKNYLNQYEKGKFSSYLSGTNPNGTRLIIQEVPFGEYTADKTISDNPNDQKNSVFSRVAALERKIEIQSVSFLKRDSVNYLTVKDQLIDLGKIDPKKIYNLEYLLKNSGEKPLEIEKIDIPCDCNTVEVPKKNLNAGESIKAKVSFNPEAYKGKVVKSVYIYVKGSSEPLRLVLTGEIN